MGIFSLMTGMAGPSGFGSASTAEQVTDGIDASNLTAIVTGNHNIFAVTILARKHVIFFLYHFSQVHNILFYHIKTLQPRYVTNVYRKLIGVGPFCFDDLHILHFLS